MTAQEKQVVIESVEWTNSKLPKSLQITCHWYTVENKEEHNWHTVRLTLPTGDVLTVRTEYVSTYAFLDGYRKAVLLTSGWEPLQAPNSPELVEA